jgi:hypothetical protein
MCCDIDENLTEKFIKKAKRTGKNYIWGYKLFEKHGSHAITGYFQVGYKYKSGKHSLKTPNTVSRYRWDNQGFHFYLEKNTFASTYTPITFGIRVKVYLKDIIGVDASEGVANSITILKRDWERGIKRMKKCTN